MHDISHDTVAHPSCAPPFPSVLLCTRFCPLGVPLGPTWLLAGLLPGRVGGSGGARRWLWSLPPGVSPRGTDAWTPCQGVTLLYGPSICTRSVQVDLRRSQVRRPFPTPGSGTLWVSGESLRDKRVSCLPRWTVCPTRSPSQDTNRSTCRGECSWSGPLATPPGRCHLGPLANGPGLPHLIACAQAGPIRTPGGPPNPRGRVPHQRLLRAVVSPAPPRSLRCWSLPPSFRPQGPPPVPRPLLCFLAPAMSRLPLLSAPAPACWCPFFSFFFLVHLSSLPLAFRSVLCPPHVPSLSPRVLALFLGR